MHICPSCGTGFQDDEEFCLDCGLKLTTEEQTTGPTNARASLVVRDALSTAQAGTGPVSPQSRRTRQAASGSSSAGSTAAGLPAPRSPEAAAASRSPVRPNGAGSRRRPDSPAQVSRTAGSKTEAQAPRAPKGKPANPPAQRARVRQPDPTTDRQMRYRPVYKAPDEWTAVTIKELLKSAGLSALVLAVAEPFDDGIDRLIEGYWGKVLVLESDLEDACRLIGDYLRGLDRSMH